MLPRLYAHWFPPNSAISGPVYKSLAELAAASDRGEVPSCDFPEHCICT